MNNNIVIYQVTFDIRTTILTIFIEEYHLSLILARTFKNQTHRSDEINVSFKCHKTFDINKESFAIRSMYCGQIVRKDETYEDKVNIVFYSCNIPELKAAYIH